MKNELKIPDDLKKDYDSSANEATYAESDSWWGRSYVRGLIERIAKAEAYELDAATANKPLIFEHPVTGEIYRFHRQDQLDMLRAKLKLDFERLEAQLAALQVSHDALLEAAIRAERKLRAYVGVCKGDKELTDTVLPMCDAAIAAAEKLTGRKG